MVLNYADHVRLSLIGEFRNHTSGAKIEQFVCTTSWAGPQASVPTDVAMEAVMDNLATACTTFWHTPNLNMPSNVHLTEVKLAPIGPNGKYPANLNAHFRTVDQGGAGGVATYPSEVAACITLRTGARGGSKRGRFYLPTNTLVTDFTFDVGNGAQDFVNVVAHQFMAGAAGTIGAVIGTGLTDPGNGEFNLVVASSKGYNTPVTGVFMGVVPDVIRRRRNKIPENYLSGNPN